MVALAGRLGSCRGSGSVGGWEGTVEPEEAVDVFMGAGEGPRSFRFFARLSFPFSEGASEVVGG
jgi:hypothetical protein